MGAHIVRRSIVLDSWPIMEWLKGREPAATRFDEIVDLAQGNLVELVMSRINYGEVIYSVRKANDIPDRDGALRSFLRLPIRISSIDDAFVDEAVELKSKYSFSYADAFAAALAIRLDVELVTGDSEFRQLEADGLLKLHWIAA